ncbi:alkylation response protein AidB-like acyl-CoA dehydrogenase [Kaistia hirudinis]|uniref:Alkylation response protein AidB-like acyl-CoA dehydrogenase n=1 Tax=Kaistia hirudinis TaxID=1293440 RepID=A0A840AP98_9HYPH|nr:acyl-CoA dehydrogenase family protein [Kaistia hirudinis]MBB3931452.1 alkylation response protein AidB-like acyl-CoA dehydrogenase [Kaistia hirudinis]
MNIHVDPIGELAAEGFDPNTVLPAASVDPAAPLRFAEAFGAALAKVATAREQANIRPTAEVAILKSSGLVNLLIPEWFGGLGGSITTALKILVALSRGDASIGALLGYHYTNSGVARLFDVEGDAEAVERLSAEGRWFWGNVSQPGARSLAATPDGQGFRLNGVKHWNTGPSLADVTTVLANRDDVPELAYGYVPIDRKGLVFSGTWDHLGLRRAETLSLEFHDVELKADEVFRSSFGPVTSFPPLYVPIGELYFASYYLGSLLGAIDAAALYTRQETRPAPGSGVASATLDPYVLHQYGEFWTEAEAALAFFLSVGREVEDGFERRRSITARERAELGVKANAVRAFVTRAGLSVTPRIYEVTGARATRNDFGFDRFWRDIRTHTLHDNQHYKLRTIGDFALNGVAHEPPSFA